MAGAAVSTMVSTATAQQSFLNTLSMNPRALSGKHCALHCLVGSLPCDEQRRYGAIALPGPVGQDQPPVYERKSAPREGRLGSGKDPRISRGSSVMKGLAGDPATCQFPNSPH